MNKYASVLFASAAAAVGLRAAAPAKIQTPATPVNEKTHSLFMGIDISVEQEKEFHRVRDVAGSSWVINLHGRPEFIPTNRVALNLKVENSLKLTDANATLGNLKTERAYLPNHDPRTQSLQQQVQASAYFTEVAQGAEMKLGEVQMAAAFGGSMDPKERGGEAPDVPKAIADLAKAQTMASGQFTDPLFHQRIGDEQLKHENYDAIAIDFDVSSEKVLPSPYLIVVAQFHERSAKPGTARRWIYAQSLDPIDTTSRKISLLRGGFPPGYELENVDLHLYDRGREVATNLSPKRVELTREEAFQYLVIEHISGNKGATLPASPAMARIPGDLLTRLAAGEGQKVYFVKVSKEGHVTEAFRDSDYTQPIEDPFFAGVVKQIWFRPALDKGQPVEGKAAVDISKLRL